MPDRQPPPLVEHCLELFAPLGPASARRMFGGHGLRIGGLFVAIVAFDRLYLKTDDATRAAFAAAGCEPFVYETRGRAVAMSYWTVPAQAMESPEDMRPWARLALEAALRAAAVAAARPSPRRRPSPRPSPRPSSRPPRRRTG